MQAGTYPHLVDQSPTPDAPFDQLPDRQPPGLLAALPCWQDRVFGQYSVDIHPQPVFLHHGGHVVPPVVAERDAAAIVPAVAGQVYVKMPGTGEGVQFPVGGRGLGVMRH